MFPSREGSRHETASGARFPVIETLRDCTPGAGGDARRRGRGVDHGLPLLNTLPAGSPLHLPDHLVPLFGSSCATRSWPCRWTSSGGTPGSSASGMSVLRPRWLRDGDVSHALDRARGGVPQRAARLHGLSRLEDAALVLARLPELPVCAGGAAVLVPGLLAWLFGYLIFRSRIRGVYFSIVTQALTMRDGCSSSAQHRLWRQQRPHRLQAHPGHPLHDPSTRLALYVISAVTLVLAYLACRAITASRFGRTLTAIRDAELRVRFLRLRHHRYKLRCGRSRPCCAVWPARSTCRRWGSSIPARCSRRTRSRWPIWVGGGEGRGTLIGGVARRLARQRRQELADRRLSVGLAVRAGGLFILVTLALPQGLVGLRTPCRARALRARPRTAPAGAAPQPWNRNRNERSRNEQRRRREHLAPGRIHRDGRRDHPRRRWR